MLAGEPAAGVLEPATGVLGGATPRVAGEKSVILLSNFRIDIRHHLTYVRREANEVVNVTKVAIAAALMVVIAGGTSGGLQASVSPLPSGSPTIAVPATRAPHARDGGVPRATARRARSLVRHVAFCARHKHGSKRLALLAASRSC